MARKLPAVISNVTPIKVGKNNASTIYSWDIRALIVSQGHKRRKGKWSGGGPFYCVRDKLEHTGGQEFTLLYGGVLWKGRSLGCTMAPGTPPKYRTGNAGGGGGQNGSLRNDAWVEGFATFNEQVLANQGRFATGYARTRPGNPQASLFQTAVELRDLPSIPASSFLKVNPFRNWGKVAMDRSQAFSKLGSEYLNIEFGWKPFVKDLQDLYKVMKTLDKQIAQLKRDNHRLIRRRGHVDDVNDTTTQVWNYPSTPNVNVNGAPPNFFGSPSSSTTTKTTTTTIKSWFSAAYVYHIMDTSSWKWDRRARAVLFGALPTPDAVWSVLPWSWLADWFFNMGDVMSNMSMNAVDNLVMRYGYIMTHTTVKTAWSVTSSNAALDRVNSSYNVPRSQLVTGSVWTRETKVRCSGSPYGMGVKYGDLSNRQKGILAALGISRSRF